MPEEERGGRVFFFAIEGGPVKGMRSLSSSFFNFFSAP